MLDPVFWTFYHHLWFHVPHFENQVYFHLQVEKNKDYNSISSFEGAAVICNTSSPDWDPSVPFLPGDENRPSL
jgi:hypothetical protein